MPVFRYTGKTRAGTTQSGEIEAADRSAAAVMLRQRQILVTSIRAKPKELSFTIPGLGNKVTEHDIVIFTRQFATMIEAGLPLVQCLDILGRQTENKEFARVITQVKLDVESGDSFADALRKHPRVFTDFYVNMVEAGEAGGILDTIMIRLATYLEKSAKLKSEVKGALVYPAVIIAVAALVVIFLLMYVIPVFAEMFSSFGATLPAPTRFVMTLSDLVRDYILYVIPLLFIGVWLFKRFYRTEKGRLTVDTMVLKLPVFGPLIQKVAVAKFTRTLGTLVSSGVPIIDGLEITARTAGNKVVENSVIAIITSIKEGQTIAEPLGRQAIFPPMVVQMIEVGENAGALDTMLNKIADFYDQEVEVAVAALTKLLEPALMVFLGVVIGGMVVAMYLPIFKIAGTIE